MLALPLPPARAPRGSRRLAQDEGSAAGPPEAARCPPQVASPRAAQPASIAAALQEQYLGFLALFSHVRRSCKRSVFGCFFSPRGTRLPTAENAASPPGAWMLSGCFVAVLTKPAGGSAWRGGAGQRILGPDTASANANAGAVRRSVLPAPCQWLGRRERALL